MTLLKTILFLCCGFLLSLQAEELLPEISDDEFLYHERFDGDGLERNLVKGGGLLSLAFDGAGWEELDGQAVFIKDQTDDVNKSEGLLYTEDHFQSDTGFRLTIAYEIRGDQKHDELAFGLVRADQKLSLNKGGNPYSMGNSLYSIGVGVNLSKKQGARSRGMFFSDNDSSRFRVLDTVGIRQKFVRNALTEVTIEIGQGGYWCYRIDGEYEASGALPEDFDLEKPYHVVIYAKGVGNEKSIQSITLRRGYRLGERAAHLRGSWNAGQSDVVTMDKYGIRTVDSTLARLNEGHVVSAKHNAPHRLLEKIALGKSCVGGEPIHAPVPMTWGNLKHDTPDEDAYLDHIKLIHSLGFGVKFYSNSECFVDENQKDLQPFVDRWIEFCDTDPEVQDFINSQPYHRGVWNRETKTYEDATDRFPMRPYIFCYAEFVLKDYALRYGDWVSSWTFDSAADIRANGDVHDSGLIEEQRIFQAFANAVHAGNPEIPLAFNNSRMANESIDDPSFPFSRATRFDDYTFGHAFNGNKDHAASEINPKRKERIFDSNFRHVLKMEETQGSVHSGGPFTYDDLVVGNFHSKLGKAAWRYSTPSAWSQEDFNEWNLRAMQAGGHMTWEGSIPRESPKLRAWAIELIKETDSYLALNEVKNAPRWARAYTNLPKAVVGQPYNHVLVAGGNLITNEKVDFWDPEGDEIVALHAVKEGFFANVPEWLTIRKNPENATEWLLEGTPDKLVRNSYEFNLVAEDVYGNQGGRKVVLTVGE